VALDDRLELRARRQGAERGGPRGPPPPA